MRFVINADSNKCIPVDHILGIYMDFSFSKPIIMIVASQFRLSSGCIDYNGKLEDILPLFIKWFNSQNGDIIDINEFVKGVNK